MSDGIGGAGHDRMAELALNLEDLGDAMDATASALDTADGVPSPELLAAIVKAQRRLSARLFGLAERTRNGDFRG